MSSQIMSSFFTAMKDSVLKNSK